MAEMRLLNDLIFNAVFAQEKNTRVLVYLLNALLNYEKSEEITSIELMNRFTAVEYVPDKHSVLDVKAVDAAGRQYNIEVQLHKESAYVERVVYYGSKLYTEQLKQGETYDDLKKTISISLIENWVLLKDEPDVCNVYTLANTASKDELTDVIEYHFIELSKFKMTEPEAVHSRFERWLYFLKYTPNLDSAMEVELLKEEGIKMALETYTRVTQDDLVRQRFLMQQKHELDEYSRLKSAEREAELRGIEKGEKLGIEKNKLATAKAFRGQGVSDDTIAAATGLSIEEIQKL